MNLGERVRICTWIDAGQWIGIEWMVWLDTTPKTQSIMHHRHTDNAPRRMSRPQRGEWGSRSNPGPGAPSAARWPASPPANLFVGLVVWRVLKVGRAVPLAGGAHGGVLHLVAHTHTHTRCIRSDQRKEIIGNHPCLPRSPPRRPASAGASRPACTSARRPPAPARRRWRG